MLTPEIPCTGLYFEHWGESRDSKYIAVLIPEIPCTGLYFEHWGESRDSKYIAALTPEIPCTGLYYILHFFSSSAEIFQVVVIGEYTYIYILS